VNRNRVILALMILVFFVINVWAMYSYFTSRFPGANDFYLRWRGGREFLINGLNPYSEEVTTRVEIGLYNAPARDDQYPGEYVYPFYTVFLFAPLSLIEDYALATAIWLVFNIFAVAGTFLLMLDLFNWRPVRWFLAFGVIWAITLYPVLRGTFLGQPGMLVALLELVAIWALVKQRDVIGGVALAVSTFKPQLGVLIIPLILLWCLRERRWRYIGAFVITSAVLVGASFLILPSWLSDWITQVTAYTDYTEIGSPVSILIQGAAPAWGTVGEALLTVILVGYALYGWFQVLVRRREDWFLWTAAVSLTVTHLVLLRTATPHYVIFFLVLVFTLREMSRRNNPFVVALLMILLSAALWSTFLSSLQGRFEHPINYLPLPIMALIILIATREQWFKGAPRPQTLSTQGTK
jgi:hypothetical protein